MEAGQLLSAFRAWDKQKLGDAGVAFTEVRDPPVDPSDPYHVVYEVRFEPVDLDKARLEIWLTNSGHVAVGIETHGRVAHRLRAKTLRSGFASGHEPTTMSSQRIEALLDCISHGRLVISATKLLGFISSLRVNVAEGDYLHIVGEGRSWLSYAASLNASSLRRPFRQTLSYRAW